MKRFLKYGLVFSVVLLMLLSIGLDSVFAQKSATFVGTVVSLHKKSITVKDSDGTTTNFLMGKKTSFDPDRLPNVGERIEVNYSLKRGNNIAYHVKIKAVQ